MTSEKELFKPLIFADHRESRSGVLTELEKLNVELVIGQPIFNALELAVGDYCLSVNVSVERKAIDDFWATFMERNLFSQLGDLAASCKRPVLIIEGDPLEFWNVRNINPDAIRGILRAIMLSYRIPIIWTLSAADTAAWLRNIAVAEQDTAEKRKFNPHGKRSSRSPHEQLFYTITSMPDIGVETATNLLNHFGSIQAIVNADVGQLKEVSNVGKKTAEHIYEFFRRNCKTC